ncbi:MAG: tRNA pseudouridine(38-40) synthase TruA [Peptococcaceae bacterium]|nr:tRNA pseudouridine(38-40) synthase TruA [Peptococcaceae bacterium]
MLTVAYDGTDFCGFQSQRGTGLPTVQECLEEALLKLTGGPVSLEGSGRTDAGVHAWGQVVNFRSQSSIPPERWGAALRPHLPDSITVRESRQVPEDFHARFSAKAKTYVYQFYCGRVMSPFYRRYACHVSYPVDRPAMAEAAAYFEGVHDFRGFCAAGTPGDNYVREIFHCGLLPDKEDGLLAVEVCGSGFLWNMVRIIAGTLLEVGAGKRRPAEIPVLLGMGDRRQSGVTLPPQGLFLMEVKYPELGQENRGFSEKIFRIK